ncbi:putative ribonuclease H-like domain-containing protein [Tanacetum coccineum]|uniref:Ribonuclease H-like domain-containing protein n=1 Tax=Tanacetum coccineum TaxID=301880 RepID=A0ABQ5EVW5_9ASTR
MYIRYRISQGDQVKVQRDGSWYWDGFMESMRQDMTSIARRTSAVQAPTSMEILVDFPIEKRAIGTKWVFRNKKDKRGIVIRNKASAFLYGTIEEEVYVTQPPGFKEPDYPNKVYKVVKALYGLHQAPRAWYETLANYLLGNGFKRGKIDQTLFIKKQKRRYFTCTGLQVEQKEDGIFISQDKYVAMILKKFNYTDVKSASTPVDLEKPLVKDGDANDVDVHL